MRRVDDQGLSNPERNWEPHQRLQSIDRAAVERRIGTTSESLTVLPGGLANLNVRIGEHRVLRIYVRDPKSIGKEALLLGRGWDSFRVPSILDRGEDFLLLEYVPHGQLLGTDGHGAAVGKALAEIHSVVFDTNGFLGPDLSIVEPLPNWMAAVEAEMAAVFGRAHDAFASLRKPFLAFYERYRTELDDPAVGAVLQHGDFKPSNLHGTTSGSLLVLDWEFAFAGPPLMDLGQLVRWSVPRPFLDAFASGYRSNGGRLPQDWTERAAVFDLVNLVEMLGRATPGSKRAKDLRARIEATIYPGRPSAR